MVMAAYKERKIVAFAQKMNRVIRKAEAPWSAAYGLLEKANAFSSCDAYAAEAFLVERSN
jgi:hypothetical protein